ncbi:MAG: ABC transporter substrate-binding protein [Spirochaetaceae bacterium]|nr:ABC transporter substrate-binding protein [Spirochaetaceae bacterium]
MKKISILLLIIILFSCRQQDDTFTILLDWTINTNHSGIFAAVYLGYFAEEGLTVQILPAADNGLELLTAGHAHFAISSQSSLTRAIERGLPLIGVATILQEDDSALASLAHLNIIRPRDLEGRRYLGWGGSVEEATIRSIVAADGGNPDLVTILPLMGNADLSALLNDVADVIWLYRGWDGVAARLLGIELNEIAIADFRGSSSYTPILAANLNFINQNEEQAKAFMRALARGYHFAAHNPQETARILLSYAPNLSADLVAQSALRLAPLYLNEDGRFGITEPERVSRRTHWLLEYGMLSHYIESERIFTNKLIIND